MDMHWADKAAERVIKEKGNKSGYVCASGITPSGTIHIGNFREIITTDLIAKALQKKGKSVKFLYSWDDFDRLRKIPPNVDKKWVDYIGMPISNVPDPFNCHESYALHFEKELEKGIEGLGFDVEYIRQSEVYGSCKYAKEIRRALNNKDQAIKILNKYRKEPLKEDWIPLTVYCEKCGKDSTKVLGYDGDFKIKYECDCGYSDEVDFSKRGIVKLPWRLDWTMRWNYEKVDFEPGGKDHSTPGGSYDTGKQIIKAIWNRDAPTYQLYEWISIKGGGQFSSSEGVITTPKEVLEVYEPKVLRWLFAGTKPGKEFSISFDLDVLQLYEDFDECERIYFDEQAVGNEKEKLNQKRIYELSCIEIPKKFPEQPGFRHLTVLAQIYGGDLVKATKGYNDKSVKVRAQCAYNWIQKYAPEEMKFKVHVKIGEEIKEMLSSKQKGALNLLKGKLEKNNYDNQSLFNEFYNICEEAGIKNTDFFEGAYLALIGKKKGPKLANFILALGKERVIKLLNEL